ncbi:MAG: tyrosine-type recombinase/integrase [Chthoniobacterales bacterium]
MLDTGACYAILLCVMPSIHRQRGRPNWFCAYTIHDPEKRENRRVFRSTKTSDKEQAREICRAWHKASLLARKGKLSADAARDVIARGVADVFLTANAEQLSSATIRGWCEKWAESKSIETEPSTHARYLRITQRFAEFLGSKADRDLATLQAADVSRFRDTEAKKRSRGTANLSLKVLRVCLGEAVRQDLLQVNAAVRVKMLKSSDKSVRRGFSVAEIRRVLKACGDDTEWRGLVLFGLYLGQRLSDLANLTWRAVNLDTGEVMFTTRKTGRRMALPLLAPLSDYLSSLPVNDDPNAFIFPEAAKATHTGTLSNRFRDILVSAGLVEPRSHKGTGKGRSHSRETSELSFHSLRHSAVTMLKQAGVSDVLAREIVGHESAAVSRQYTHLTTADMRAAMEKLPDLTGS